MPRARASSLTRVSWYLCFPWANSALPLLASSEFYCTLTLDLCHEPVIDPDGYTYERTVLEEWFRKSLESHRENCRVRGTTVGATFQPRSPLTGAVLPNQNVVPVHALRSLCEQYSQTMMKLRMMGNEHQHYNPSITNKENVRTMNG